MMRLVEPLILGRCLKEHLLVRILLLVAKVVHLFLVGAIHVSSCGRDVVVPLEVVVVRLLLLLLHVHKCAIVLVLLMLLG